MGKSGCFTLSTPLNLRRRQNTNYFTPVLRNSAEDSSVPQMKGWNILRREYWTSYVFFPMTRGYRSFKGGNGRTYVGTLSVHSFGMFEGPPTLWCTSSLFHGSGVGCGWESAHTFRQNPLGLTVDSLWHTLVVILTGRLGILGRFSL